MRILAIETSCDETSIAIIDMSGPVYKPYLSVLSHVISSQVKIHEKFGGVVPNLAAREHQKNLVPILLKVLKETKFLNSKSKARNPKQILNSILEREQELFARIREHVIPLQTPNIDAIAVTIGPGLEPALWIGINFAKALSVLWDKPVIPVNHMEGHIVSALLTSADSAEQRRTNAEIRRKQKKLLITHYSLPAIALLVSGGHTELVLIKGIGKYKILGETVDDAAGEAFDKVARLLGLGYPGGPQIAHLAQSARQHKINFMLPRPMINSKDLNFSFSGLKTAVLYLIKGLEKQRYDIKKIRPAIAKEFQDAVVDVLISKTMKAVKQYKAKTILLGGGVAANKLLRTELSGQALLSKARLLTSPMELTGDNALMIAVAAFFQKKKARKNIFPLKAIGHLRLS